ncbi:manganese efflux pump MntP family protein [Anaeromassilibacillus senegalensis]|uniref:Putative manganese efflux pump MntP n=1 Tax=Anaeromassilibacillus senegalensis TaxID=1673717 RepID=A0ABS9CJI8_9FIRM|nr:manganese efflux pump MntP family protein [Anaeromassilibacillus senegalensis]MCF2651239.1 manganese efflux pump [Anaeromassilibacillus senegalensis]
MSVWELFILAVGLSMDAFAVSVCKGLSVKALKPKHMLIAGLYFGGFQALMPLIGYLLGVQFQSLIQEFDHWIAFVLLVLIGLSMIRESRECPDELNDSFSFKTMLPLAVATSIDALAVGVTFAFLKVSIVPAVSFIGVTTFILSAAGIRIGNIFGAKYKSRAELIGGLVLILMGVKILLEHLGVFDWFLSLFA